MFFCRDHHGRPRLNPFQRGLAFFHELQQRDEMNRILLTDFEYDPSASTISPEFYRIFPVGEECADQMHRHDNHDGGEKSDESAVEPRMDVDEDRSSLQGAIDDGSVGGENISSEELYSMASLDHQLPGPSLKSKETTEASASQEVPSEVRSPAVNTLRESRRASRKRYEPPELEINDNGKRPCDCCTKHKFDKDLVHLQCRDMPLSEQKFILQHRRFCYDNEKLSHSSSLDSFPRRNHDYCKQCLKVMFCIGINNESVFPPKCCGKVISLEQVASFLPYDMVQSYKEKECEYSSAKRLYCSIPECSKFILPKAISNGTGACEACGTKTCTICRFGAHEGECPKDLEKEKLFATAFVEGWQSCKKCGRVIERYAGSNKIACYCGYQFCYICGQEWRNCTCETWEERLLHQRAERLVSKAIDGEKTPAAPLSAHILGIRDYLREQQLCDEKTHNWIGSVGLKNRNKKKANGEVCELCGHHCSIYYFICGDCGVVMCDGCHYGMKILSLYDQITFRHRKARRSTRRLADFRQKDGLMEKLDKI
ncbi:MAG: hypothetical protein M1834_007888 [Cirrosporium novae-zelandiae]|nr:MAG: hypothetical protein M1834_007888 [Cirrosporium novae-zelandiae]